MQVRGSVAPSRPSAIINVLDPSQIGNGKTAGSVPRGSVLHPHAEQMPDWVAAQKKRMTMMQDRTGSKRATQFGNGRGSVPEYKTRVTTLTLGGFGDDFFSSSRGSFMGHTIHGAIAGGRLSSMGIQRNTLIGTPRASQGGKRGTVLPRFLFGSEDVDDFTHADGSRRQEDTQQASTPKWVPPPPIATINRNNDLLEEDHLRVILGEMDSEFMTKIQAAAEAISNLFEEADSDGDGLVSYFDTKAVFRKISYNLAEDVDKHLPEELRSVDGKINHDRFVAVFIPLALSVPEEVVIARVPAGMRRGSAMPDMQGARRTLLGVNSSTLADLTPRRGSVARKSFAASAGLKLGPAMKGWEKLEEEPSETVRATPQLMQGVQEIDKVVADEMKRRSDKKRLTVDRKGDARGSMLATTSDCRRSMLDVIGGNSKPLIDASSSGQI